MTAHTGEIRRVSVSPDGKFVITAGADNDINIFDATDATLIPGRTFTLTDSAYALNYTKTG